MLLALNKSHFVGQLPQAAVSVRGWFKEESMAYRLGTFAHTAGLPTCTQIARRLGNPRQASKDSARSG
ncbi:MAG: hypothetical protein ABI193_13295 [Minicystis sp.]